MLNLHDRLSELINPISITNTKQLFTMVIDETRDRQKTYSNQLDEKLHVKASVYIHDKLMDYSALRLEQRYSDHHYFEFTVPFDILQEVFIDDPMEQIDLIGKDVRIEFTQGSDSASTYLFDGIVTGIEMTGENGKHGHVTVRGASPTILLERAKRFDVYSEMELKQLFDKLTKIKHISKPYTVNNPNYTNPVDFLMQYQETDWQLIRRICYQYGINVYYSGLELILGDQGKEWKEVNLTYDKEISTIRFGSRLLQNSFTNYSYIPENDEKLERESSPEIPNANAYVSKTNQQSGILDSDAKSVLPSDVPMGNVGGLNDYVEAGQSSKAAATVYVKGEAKTYQAAIGRIVNIHMPENMSKVSGLGAYRVIECTHTIDTNLRYTNTFTAVPAGLKTIPVNEPYIPVAQPQLATVTHTDDPKGQGRVRVEFQFPSYNISSWLRVMTPDAGLTTDKEKNRGILFVPEKGSQVMVGFERGNPNFPYVMGSMFHGKNGIGGQANNAIKSIITRSGHTIEFDDAADTLCITIKDKNGNIIHLDTKGKNINITAPETINFNANNINITAKETVTIQGSKISEQSKEHEVLAENTFSAESNVQKLKSNNYIQSSTSTSQIISGNKVEIKGSKVDIAMGGTAQSPKAPKAARDMTSQLVKPKTLLESELLPEDNMVEQQGSDPKVVKITLFDDNGNETEYLSRSTNVEVETKDMAGKKIELKLKDKETGDIIHFGDYFIPANDYVIKTNVKKAERHKVD